MPKKKEKVKVTHQKIVGQKKEKAIKHHEAQYDDLGNIIKEPYDEEIEVIKNIVEDVTEEIEVEVEEQEEIKMPKSLEERISDLEKAFEELKANEKPKPKP